MIAPSFVIGGELRGFVGAIQNAPTPHGFFIVSRIIGIGKGDNVVIQMPHMCSISLPVFGSAVIAFLGMPVLPNDALGLIGANAVALEPRQPLTVPHTIPDGDKLTGRKAEFLLAGRDMLMDGGGFASEVCFSCPHARTR